MLNHQTKINQINGSAMINQKTDYLNFDDHKLLTRSLPLEQKNQYSPISNQQIMMSEPIFL